MVDAASASVNGPRGASDNHGPGQKAGTKKHDRAPWAAHSLLLAQWTMATLVNRTDVWGGYRPLHPRELDKETGSIWTKPAREDRGKKFLCESIIVQHFKGYDVGRLIGLHSTSAVNTSRWGAVDIDWHGESSSDPQINQVAALGWYSKLTEMGFRPLLTDSNGAGGFHLLPLFSEPAPTRVVFAFLRWLVSDHERYGLPTTPETFPKQARIEQGRFGNWLRLPGRHYTRDHWSRVWDGRTWLEGALAVDHILALRGSPPECIPAEALAFLSTERPVTRTVNLCPVTGPADGLARRIQSYMSRLPNLAEGYGRDDVAYCFAAFLVRDLQLSDDAALPWLAIWDNRNRPPKGEDRLRQILQNVHAYGKRAYGSGLREYRNANRHKPKRVVMTFRVRA